MAGTSSQRDVLRDQQLRDWAKAHRLDLERFDLGQQWVIFFALRVMAHLDRLAPLKRMLGFFLAHSGMGLGSGAIAAIIGVSDRAVRNTQVLDPPAMLRSVQQPVRGHRKAKLEAHHAGVIAKFLVEHPRALVQEVLDFITKELGITIDRLTLRRYVARYGLGCLREDVVTEAPLFSAELATEELSC
jgi:transposase